MKCPYCKKENPIIDWCADVDYGKYSLKKLEDGHELGITFCEKCEKEVKITIKAVKIEKTEE